MKGWYMQWCRAWGYSTRKMVSLGHRICNGFRGPSTSLLVFSSRFSWWPMLPGQKLWHVIRGRSGWECQRRWLGGKVRKKELPTGKRCGVIFHAQTAGLSWRRGQLNIAAGACVAQSRRPIVTSYQSVRLSMSPRCMSSSPQGHD